MRVIGGMYRGRTLRTVADLSVRPATDRVRQTIFDMLATRLELEGAHVLDLFAGSGSLGIEALSRGAARATFVESAHAAAAFITHNLRALGCQGAADVLETDAMALLAPGTGTWNLVFADPPYAWERTAEIPRLAFEGGLIRSGGYLLIEHPPAVAFAHSASYRPGPVKRFGRTHVTFFTPSEGRMEVP
ncbi:MAG TPA: 16S rRNA (guanine(966)-N(2))-methyltransferase RsmD [Bacteroidota bacterium]|nr:16S rRNA (guanine(966)-N(2))-methyltransferase RsmD [Bacteroidota bacterium]